MGGSAEMSCLTSVSDVLAVKDEAIMNAVDFINRVKRKCDMGTPEKEDHENECQGSEHWFYCEEHINPMLKKLMEAFRSR